MKNVDKGWQSQVCVLINSLQITLSQIRFTQYLRNELDTEYALQDGEENELAEMMHCGVRLYSDQTYDLALLNKRQLIQQINQILSEQGLTSNHLLEEDSHDIYRVNVTGQLETKIKFESVGTYEQIPAHYRYPSPEEGVCLWMVSRDYRELLVDRSAIDQKSGEIYIGTGILSRIFWPFLIDLDGTCVAVNDMMSEVVEIECSEK